MIYDALIAPFTEFEFMRRALAAVIALSLGGAPIGVFLMLRRMSLVGDAMAHAILPGAAIGFLLSGLNLFAMTTGGLIVAEQALYALWGPQIIPLPLPTSLRGSFILGDVAISKYRLLAMLVGLAVFFSIQLVLNRTKIGLLIRAGVENREMVEALGYRIRRLFLGVFMVGSALAGLGGIMWALYREQVHASMGNDLTVLVFIVVIIGGLGSIGGCFIGALLVAMVANYGGFLVPKLALVSNILLMVAILMWRPRGLYAVTSR